MALKLRAIIQRFRKLNPTLHTRGRAEMNKVLVLALAAMCNGCAINIEMPDVVERGGATFDGPFNVQYLAVSGFGPGVAYQTGSNLGAAQHPIPVNAPPSIATAESGAADILVHGPEPLASATAQLAARAFEISRNWYPTDFSGRLDLSIELIEDGPVRFGDAFILERSPWPMAFKARYDPVMTRCRRTKPERCLSARSPMRVTTSPMRSREPGCTVASFRVVVMQERSMRRRRRTFWERAY